MLATITAYQITVGGETEPLTAVCPGLQFLVTSLPYVHDSLSYCLPSTRSYNDNRKNRFFATDNRFLKTNDFNISNPDLTPAATYKSDEELQN